MRLFPLCGVVLQAAVWTGTGCSGEKGEDCAPNHKTVCKEGAVFWVDSCGNQGDKAGDCECGCNADFSGCKDPCECVPDCSGRTCGSNGCGGLCPPGCLTGQTCVDGTCQGQCQPSCAGRCCGGDGCGGSCTDDCASTGQTCDTQSCLCEGDCTPDCAGRDCGPDGCGGSCGFCGENFTCQDGACTCPNTACGQACCAPGEICQSDSCCLADCTDRDCGTSCAGVSCGVCGQGFFCDLLGFRCIESGVENCFNGEICPPEHPNCMMSCTSREARCCDVAAGHPYRVDGTLDDSCEVCCKNPDYPHPVVWPDGATSCCAAVAPYPFPTCDTHERMCCPQVTVVAHRCDGTTDTECRVCCNVEYPVGVVFPDGHTGCCPLSSPWPCVNGQAQSCCDQSGQCG